MIRSTAWLALGLERREHTTRGLHGGPRGVRSNSELTRTNGAHKVATSVVEATGAQLLTATHYREGKPTNKVQSRNSRVRVVPSGDKASTFVWLDFFVPRKGPLKGNNMKYPMIDLESEIYSTEALIDLLASQLGEHLNALENDEAGRVAAGLVNLSHERRRKLREAYDAAHAHYVKEVRKV